MRRIVALALVAGLLLAGSASIVSAAPYLSAQHNEHKKKPKHEQHGTGRGSTTPDEPPEPQDLPLKWLFISLGISLVIGAAGGEIFASLSPRREDESDQTPGRPAPT